MQFGCPTTLYGWRARCRPRTISRVVFMTWLSARKSRSRPTCRNCAQKRRSIPANRERSDSRRSTVTSSIASAIDMTKAVGVVTRPSRSFSIKRHGIRRMRSTRHSPCGLHRGKTICDRNCYRVARIGTPSEGAFSPLSGSSVNSAFSTVFSMPRNSQFAMAKYPILARTGYYCCRSQR